MKTNAWKQQRFLECRDRRYMRRWTRNFAKSLANFNREFAEWLRKEVARG